MKDNKSNLGKVLTIGTGAVAMATLGYLLLGPNGKKNQKKTKAWMTEMKADIFKKMESVKDITKETYENIVDTVSSAYTTVAENKDEVAELARELKGHWKAISSKAMPKKKKIVKK